MNVFYGGAYDSWKTDSGREGEMPQDDFDEEAASRCLYCDGSGVIEEDCADEFPGCEDPDRLIPCPACGAP